MTKRVGGKRSETSVAPGSKRGAVDGEKSMNFKVSEDFHRAFKVYAAKRGISMTKLLIDGFDLVKRENGDE